MIEIALFQPDIAANTGAIARLCACFGLKLTIIEPAGFAWNDSSLRRAGMDYLASLEVQRAESWEAFEQATRAQRRFLLTTKASASYLDVTFQRGDILVLGRESLGAPETVHAACHGITIPMQPGMRSLNVAMASAIVAAEAIRQLR
jgi:tRNA (cytidine/uridine-2'-O-)-methyltransferase